MALVAPATAGLIAKAAREMGIDRAELRRRNHIAPQQMPYKAPSGMNYDSGEFTAILDKAQAHVVRAQIAEITRVINLNIRPMDYLSLCGVAKRWTTPLVTFAHGAGDCEDYGIAKYAALRQIGIAEEDLRLVVVYDKQAQEHHAVAAVRHAGRWLVLDNRTLAVQEDADIAHFTPMFTLDSQGVKRLAAAPRKAPAGSTLNMATARIDRNAVSAEASIAPATPFLL